MKKSYKVAGHVFSVVIPDGDAQWDRMQNYKPFETADCPDEIFSLERTEPFPVDGKQPVYVEPAEDPDQPKVELYRLGEDWLFEMAPVQSMRACARVIVSPDYRQARYCVATTAQNIADFALNNALMLVYAFRTATLGTLEMHSSVIVNGGRGYMFLGKSGTGKSTHSSLWLKYIPGSRLLNDDNPIVRVMPDGTVRVFGSPWSGKTPCYINDDAPVGAIVRLRQHPENIIKKMSAPEAYASIYSSSSGFKANKVIADGLYETVAAVVTAVPCYLLDCLPDEAAAQLSHDTVSAPSGQRF